STGEVVGAVTYLAVGLQPALRSVVRTVGSWGLQLDVVLGRLAEIIASAPPNTAAVATGRTRPDARPVPVPRRHDLSTHGLTFGYGPRARSVVRDLDLRIEPGEHLAVVGPSGAGKSTLAALLCGLVNPRCGQVRLGGQGLDRIDPTCLRRAVALIPQEAYVFTGTVRDNLDYLDAGISSARRDAAVAALGVEPLVARLGGYDAPVRPADLSGGERQLLALTRVYLSPARVVLLDEATSLLDPAAEARVEAAFTARPGSLVVVAHRISSALRADRVLLLDGGVALVGSHADLLARSRLYADLLGYWDAGRHAAGPHVPARADHPTVGPLADATNSPRPAGRTIRRTGG
ncbi:MAG TPA: ATP-binding cassette domain-containing protein, partial [Mycobacteriales bacterium]